MDDPPVTTGTGAAGRSPRPARRGDVLLPLLTVVSDTTAIGLASLASYWLRFRTTVFDSLGFLREDAPPFTSYLLGSVAVIVIWLLLFNARRMYRPRRNVSLSDELINVTKVVSLGMLIVMSVAFFYREFSFSRVVSVLLWGGAIVSLFAGRASVHAVERWLYRRGTHLQQAIIVGNDALASRVWEKLNGHESFGLRITGYFADAPAPAPLPLTAARWLGAVESAAGYLRGHPVDVAFLALRSEEHPRLLRLISECEGLTIEFMMVPDLLELLTGSMQVRELEGIPFLRIKGIPLTFWGRAAKRTFDLLCSAVLLVVLSPLFLILAVAIRIDSPGPVFFVQDRVGLDGRRFRMFKFRSMHTGAEVLDDRAGLGIRDDPRRTRVGAVIRRFSLDELPQLFNVLAGEMSLVGPRPERSAYVDQFHSLVPRYRDRHRVKTGMTGWAQVNGLRGDTSIDERIKYDLFYIEHWSLAFDVKILLRTLRAALITHGAE